MAYRALGTTLSKGGTTIGGLTEIGGVDMSADTIDVTTLDSAGGYREYLASFKDAGEVSLSGFFVPGDAGQVSLAAAFESGASDTYIITFPTQMGAAWTFTAVVTKFTTNATVEDPVSFECTLKVSSQPVLGTTPSTGASAIAAVASDGNTALTAYEITPAFSTSAYFYAVTYTTETSFKVKVTASSHTIHMYVDGVYHSDLTSGVASAAISQSAAASKEIKVICYEAAKTPKTYTLIVGRVS